MREPPRPTNAASTGADERVDVAASEQAPELPSVAEVPGRRRRSFWAELPLLVVVAFVLALLLKTFLVQAFFIPSSSMEPTLAINDRVLVEKVGYRFGDPDRGDVVVFTKRDVPAAAAEQTVQPSDPFGGIFAPVAETLGLSRPDERDFIKRVIGMPGETLEMVGGEVLVDGAPLPEGTFPEGGYLATRDEASYGPFEVPDDEYFMMGDNRPNSADSRFPDMGTVPRDDVVGRAFVVIWPFDRLANLAGIDYPGSF